MRPCEHPACGRSGDYRAPKSRGDIRAYYWFCLDHVREYNAAWDYFAGMSQKEIEEFQHNNASWHRPTWRLGAWASKGWYGGLASNDLDFMDGAGREPGNGKGGCAPRAFKPGERQALAQLNLDWPVTLKEIKNRYKALVKRHHPDANGGDKAAEERLKTIIQAYTDLLSCGYS